MVCGHSLVVTLSLIINETLKWLSSLPSWTYLTVSPCYTTHTRTHARTHTGGGGGGGGGGGERERSVLGLSVEVVGDFCLPALAYDVFQVIDSDGGFCTFDATGANC